MKSKKLFRFYAYVLSCIIAVMSTFSSNSVLLTGFAENADLEEENSEEFVMCDVEVPLSVIEEHSVSDEEILSSLGTTFSNINLPSSVDLSTDPYFPTIRSQGSHQGSCAAFATTYYQYTYEVSKLKNINAKASTANQYSPKWSYNITNNGENLGSRFDDIYNVLEHRGAVKWSQFPYNSTSDNASEYLEWCLNTDYMKEALEIRLKNWGVANILTGTEEESYINSYNDVALNSVKNLLKNKKVLLARSSFGLAIVNTSNYGDIAIYNTNKSSGHAFVIVGYDDNVCYDLNNNGTIEDFERGAFKIANSWGTTWGNNGFCWVMYDALNKVSNADNLNVSGRQPIFCRSGDKNAFMFINVEEKNPVLMAEVTLRQKTRKSTSISLGVSNTQSGSPVDITTSYNNIGGEKAFDGGQPQYQNATFVFDYDINGNCFPDTQNVDKYISLTGETLPGEGITMKSIKLIDDVGYIIDQCTGVSVPAGGSQIASLGKISLGDVDYNGSLNSIDIGKIRQFIAGQITFSDLQKKLCDVNNDGVVNETDISLLNAMI